MPDSEPDVTGSAPLRLLHVEDDSVDVELVARTLSKSGFTLQTRVVATVEDLTSALDAGDFDLILADFTLPTFTGLDALRLVRERRIATPFIIVSGTVGEDVAVEALKAGATDYVIKDRLQRLGMAVERALSESETRSERERAERERDLLNQKLRIETTFLDAVLRHIPAGIVIAEAPSGRIVRANARAETLFGDRVEATSATDHGRAVLLDGSGERVPVDRYPLVRAVRAGETVVNEELELVRPDGSSVWLIASAAPIRSERGEVTAGVACYNDITDRRDLEAQLRHSAKMDALGRLAGGVAHDFNNLMTGVLGFAELALAQLRPGERFRDYFEQIRTAGERAAGLTQQLLAFGRKQMLRPVVLDLNEAVARSERLLARLIGEDIELRFLRCSGTVLVRADPSQLEQVIVNLAVNARDAMPGGGHIAIETRACELDEARALARGGVRPGRYVELVVTDTGSGMDAETAARVFEPFFTTKQERGTGLGLATVHGIVEQSGGHVRVFSAPGRGSAFTVTLPRVVAAEAEPAPVAAEAAAAAQTEGTETILLVEDEEIVRSMAHLALEAKGYTVLEAADFHGAVRQLERNEDIALLVTDVVLPGRNGIAVAREAERIRPGVRVIYMSGYAEEAVIEQGLAEDGVVFLAKPITPTELLARVREALDAPPPARAGGGSGPVLVVDDSLTVRGFTCSVLAEAGLAVIEAPDAERALELARQAGSVGVLVSDVLLPGMSGFELADRLRERDPSLPVLFVTGSDDAPDVVEQASRRGASCLRKPVAPEELVAKVRELLAVRDRGESA